MRVKFNLSLTFGLFLLILLAACGSEQGPGDAFYLDPQNAQTLRGSASSSDLTLQGYPEVIQDDNARLGYGFKFLRTDDELRWNLKNVQTGTYEVSVSARAEAYEGAPKLALELGGTSAEKPFNTETYQRISYGTFELSNNEEISLRFTNDLWGGSLDKDRNIVVDYVYFERTDDPTPRPDEESITARLSQLLIDDMNLPHEARPHGVPDYLDWRDGPRLSAGNEPGDFEAFTTWGQVYEAASGNEAVNTRIQIRNLRAYILSKETGQWSVVQNAQVVEGAAYAEDFQNDVNRPANVRAEADNGGISVTVGGGYNYHFWDPAGRAEIDSNDIGGVVVTVESRLVVGDPTLEDDRDRALYVMGVGADYWLNLEAVWDQWKTNYDVGIGRHRLITNDWQLFTMSTLSDEQARETPPPVNFP